jgi:hypothetical protein
MISEILHQHVGDVDPTIATTALFGLLMLLGLITFSSVVNEDVLPGIPRLKGFPVIGAAPLYFRDGMALLLENMTKIGEDGISYTRVGNKTLVSVHDPVMAKEVLGYNDKICSRFVYPIMPHNGD